MEINVSFRTPEAPRTTRGSEDLFGPNFTRQEDFINNSKVSPTLLTDLRCGPPDPSRPTKLHPPTVPGALKLRPTVGRLETPPHSGEGGLRPTFIGVALSTAPRPNPDQGGRLVEFDVGAALRKRPWAATEGRWEARPC